MEALGRLFNVHPLADDAYVNLRYAAAVTFIGYNAAGETWTLTEAKDASGTSAQVLATISRYYTQATAGAAWVLSTAANVSVVTTTASQDAVAIHVAGVELSDTFTHLKLTSTSTGTVVAITHDLMNPRDPANLPVIGT